MKLKHAHSLPLSVIILSMSLFTLSSCATGDVRPRISVISVEDGVYSAHEPYTVGIDPDRFFVPPSFDVATYRWLHRVGRKTLEGNGIAGNRLICKPDSALAVDYVSISKGKVEVGVNSARECGDQTNLGNLTGVQFEFCELMEGQIRCRFVDPSDVPFMDPQFLFMTLMVFEMRATEPCEEGIACDFFICNRYSSGCGWDTETPSKGVVQATFDCSDAENQDICNQVVTIVASHRLLVHPDDPPLPKMNSAWIHLRYLAFYLPWMLLGTAHDVIMKHIASTSFGSSP